MCCGHRVLVMQKIAEDVDRTGLRGCLEAPRLPLQRALEFCIRVLPATEAEIDLDGRQLISEKHVARLFQGRQMESGLKVSVAPLSTVCLTLWKDFFCWERFEICAQLGVHRRKAAFISNHKQLDQHKYHFEI